MDYNVKCLHYINGDTETRVYSRPVQTGRDEEKEKKRKAAQVPDDKGHSIIASMNRTKNQIYSYARANRWEWFLTLTFSPQEVDRKDYAACTKLLSKWLNNARRTAPLLKYLFVPEQHKDGAWHFHGLMSDTGSLAFLESGHFTRSGQVIYNLLDYGCGFSTATRVMDTDAVSWYITKYITKDMCALTPGRKRYWHSRNLDTPDMEYFLMESADCLALEEELREDCRWEKYVECPSINRNVRYFQNSGLTIHYPDFNP